MAKILLLPHHHREDAAILAKKAIAWLEARGHQVAVLEQDAQPTGLTRWAVPTIDDCGVVDLAVSLGGDGTMLHALDKTCPLGVPTMGVNLGHLGYLAEVEPEQLEVALSAFLGGNYRVEERMTLETVVTTAPERDPTHSTISLSRKVAVNEVVVEKTSSGNTVRLAAAINGKDFLSYAVDGMIIATPTGSTAYNLSARGPILSPTMRALLMTPVSPHMLFDRSMVLDGSEVLELTVIGDRPASVVADGQHISTIAPGASVTCKQSDRPARVVVITERDFRQTLKSKFGLMDR